MATILGIIFTMLWASASIATKFGIVSTTPLTLALLRFAFTGFLLFMFIHIIKREALPKRSQWRALFLLGLLNTTIYLGATFWALQYVSAGLFNLFVTVNPFIVALLSYIWLCRPFDYREWMGMGIAATGLIIATYPSLITSKASLTGIIVLTIGMLAMAIGSVYFSKVKLDLPSLTINTWQILIGGVLLLPVAYFTERKHFFIVWDFHLFGALFWLTIIISVFTMLLWFYLLKTDPVKANNWLFLTPVFGYLFAWLLLGEKITLYDIIATLLIIFGLFLSGNISFHKTTNVKETT